jgi:hypothetical protein
LHAHSTWEAQVIQELLNRDPPRAPEDQQPSLLPDFLKEEEEPFLTDTEAPQENPKLKDLTQKVSTLASSQRI